MVLERGQWNRTEDPDIGLDLHSHPSFYKDAKIYIREKASFSTNGAGKPVFNMQKNEIRPSPFTLHKTQLQIIKDPNIRPAVKLPY